MIPANVKERLSEVSWHVCERCLRPPTRIFLGARVRRGTQVFASCHGRGLWTVIPDVAAEDMPRWWWWLDSQGKPLSEFPSAARQRLIDDRERARAALKQGDEE